MSSYKTPENIQAAVDAFRKLPGVGERTALRNVLQVLNWKQEEVETYSRAVLGLNSLKRCVSCHVFCDGEGESQCSICQSEERKSFRTICVVEAFTDFLAIENSGRYKGLYHVLGGVLNPLLGIAPEDLSINDLKMRVKQDAIEHVILAINPSLEGEATCSYLNEVLAPYCEVERIGFGVPMGGSLEFLDAQTISTALDNRTRFN